MNLRSCIFAQPQYTHTYNSKAITFRLLPGSEKATEKRRKKLYHFTPKHPEIEAMDWVPWTIIWFLCYPRQAFLGFFYHLYLPSGFHFCHTSVFRSNHLLLFIWITCGRMLSWTRATHPRGRAMRGYGVSILSQQQPGKKKDQNTYFNRNRCEPAPGQG